jgi:hypothetical protein
MLGGLHSSDNTSLENLKALPSRATLARRFPRLRVNRFTGAWRDDASGKRGDTIDSLRAYIAEASR